MKGRSFELSGKWVVALILVLTAVVGALFIYLGPRATEKRPGVLHLGLRYENERSIEFLRYGKDGPAATIEFLESDTGSVVFTMSELRIGRNLIPIEKLDAGAYTARISAKGYETVNMPVHIEGRLVRPADDFVESPGRMADDNMLGVRLSPEAGAFKPGS